MLRKLSRTRWLRLRPTLSEALEYRLPFGKYLGRTMGELGQSEEGRKYLMRLVDNHDSRTVVELAKLIILDTMEASE